MLALCKQCIMPDALTPTSLSNAAGISVPYACQILKGKRQPSREIALAIYRATGRKFGHLSGLSDRDAKALARLEAKAVAA
jgi:hypothetical protein